MSHKLLRLIVAGCLTVAWVPDALAQIRTSPTPGQAPPARIIHPQSQFDQAAATRALDKGTSTIKGAACARNIVEIRKDGQTVRTSLVNKSVLGKLFRCAPI